MSFEQNNKGPDQMRCACYLRTASDMARQASLEDQERLCQKFADGHGWIVPEECIYIDAGKSGTSAVGGRP